MNTQPNPIPQHATNQNNPPPIMQQQTFVNQSQQPQPPPPQSTVQNVQPNQSQMSTNSNQLMQQEIIAKTKKLLQDLKESLANLMNLLAKNISYNHQIDSGTKVNMEKCSRFDKAWGEFNSICNQVESHFKTLHECALLKKENKTYIPYDLSPLSQIESQHNTITYGQYVNLVKNQVNYSKAVQEILNEGARKISQMEHTSINQQNIHNQQHYHQIQNQPKPNMIINQIPPQQQHSYPMQIANQAPMNPMNSQISQPIMQQKPIQRGPINTNPMQPGVQQQPMMQQPMTNQMNPMQTTTYQPQIPAQQINNQMKYMPHNQM